VIFSKFFKSISAQFNKLANFFWEQDPIAVMRLEYDKAVEDLKAGRVGLEEYRGLVERVTRQVQVGEKHVAKLQAQTKAYLKAGDRPTASKFAIELKKAQAQLAQNQEQLDQHEAAYNNHLKKIKHANKTLGELKEKIKRLGAELKMSEAEAEVAKIGQSLNFDVTTDFGEMEDVIQSRIDKNRGTVRVASDLSEEGIAAIDAEEAMEASLAEDALRELEMEMGLVTPETVDAPEVEKQLGPVTGETN
jgi:phage shock protein A